MNSSGNRVALKYSPMLSSRRHGTSGPSSSDSKTQKWSGLKAATSPLTLDQRRGQTSSNAIVTYHLRLHQVPSWLRAVQSYRNSKCEHYRKDVEALSEPFKSQPLKCTLNACLKVSYFPVIFQL